MNMFSERYILCRRNVKVDSPHIAIRYLKLQRSLPTHSHVVPYPEEAQKSNHDEQKHR